MKTHPSAKTISRNSFLRAVTFGLPFASVAALKAEDVRPALADTAKPDLGNLRAFVELARSDIRTQKSLLFAENIDFTADEAVEFWPVYREYDLELSHLLDRRNELILQYASQYRSMTDDQAKRLAEQAFDIEARRTALKRKYLKKFSKIVPALKAVRFFQIENQIQMALDLQVAASLPLIK